MQARGLRSKTLSDVYDVQAYKQLLDELRSAPMSDDTRGAYEELVQAFPYAVSTSGGAYDSI